MTETEQGGTDQGLRPDWLAEELADVLDEDFELELEDAALSREIARIYRGRHPDAMDSHSYLSGLIHLQAELIKLQDRVQHSGQKVVVLFEGRDSAGKGGVIKRITQRLKGKSSPFPGFLPICHEQIGARLPSQACHWRDGPPRTRQARCARPVRRAPIQMPLMASRPLASGARPRPKDRRTCHWQVHQSVRSPTCKATIAHENRAILPYQSLNKI